jgi:enamine deaminase RidA (YjgF/YER057c/UK114 family)
MTTSVLQPPGWASPLGYANGIAAPDGQIVFIAGQVGWNAEQRFTSEDLVPQFEQALENVLAVLREAGGVPRDICRMTAYCTDKPAYLAARRQIGRIWRRLMGTHYPAMTLIFVADLLDAPGKIELEATAVVPAAENRVWRA